MTLHLLPSLITCLALLVYSWNIFVAGGARGKYGIKAPAVTGHPQFECRLRVQQNMLEQLIVFLPALWIFSTTVSPLIGAIVGLVFVIGRVIYSLSYYNDPAKRGPGFMISGVATLILLIGGLAGTLRFLLGLA
jgi:glutathione S-transferase